MDNVTKREAVAAGPVTISREAFDFLMGAGPMDGTWFGELNDGLPGAFWWRAILRAAERESVSALDAAEARIAELEGQLAKIRDNAMNEGMGLVDFRYTTARRCARALKVGEG